jgi:GT2 family glycosyltransferase
MNRSELLNNANYLFRNGRYEDALIIYESLAAKDPFYERLIQYNLKVCKNRVSDKVKNIHIQKENTNNLQQIDFSSFGIIRNNPLISVIIVSFNSSKDLKTLLPTIKNQTYQNFELLVLENGTENTQDLCEEIIGKTRLHYFKQKNIGFAAGNNYCYDRSNGEFIALVNPDTKLERNFLQELLDSIRYDQSAAIVAPKINFFEKYVSLLIEGDGEFSINIKPLLSKLSYKKYFLRSGSLNSGFIVSDVTGLIKIDIPHPEINLNIPIEINKNQALTRVKVTIGFESNWTIVEEKIDENGILKSYINLTLNELTYGSARYLINNAGSGINPDGDPYDRGFGEYEEGAYLSKTYLSAFCGCAALIRRSSLINRKIFINEFFAYYEDSELSWWMMQHKYKILYCPTAIVYHKHSESTEENSPSWKCLVRRGRDLYNFMTSQNSNIDTGKYLNLYKDVSNVELVKRLEKLDININQISSKKELYRQNSKKLNVCIYDTYFYSMGGGEKHALDIAELLQDDYDVYLVSEVDFDIKNLSDYFGLDLTSCRKIISTNIDSHFTSKFDIFINSTFHSNLIPYSKYAYYIVSFPHSHAIRGVLERYHFLHNSPFTKHWAEKYWGEHKSSLVLPIIGYKKEPLDLEFSKEKKLLSVGRITSDGHCKNHHLVIQAFKIAVDEGKLIDWELIIVGSCDLSNNNAYKYYELLLKISKGYKIKIKINLGRDILNKLYKVSFAYVHATGVGLPENEPEKHEHFGITPHEAMRSGCFPIVYELGGPSEQMNGLNYHEKFKTIDSMKDCIIKVTGLYSVRSVISEEIANFAKSKEDANYNFLKSFFI